MGHGLRRKPGPFCLYAIAVKAKKNSTHGTALLRICAYSSKGCLRSRPCGLRRRVRPPRVASCPHLTQLRRDSNTD
jgi:hypothetical protein